MKIKHNFILMSLVSSLLLLLIFLNSFNLLTISKSYYNNFELAVSSSVNQQEYVKVYIQLRDNNEMKSKAKDILAEVINLAAEDFNFILAGVDKKININNKKKLKEVFNETENIFKQELNLINAKRNLEIISNKGEVIIITDDKILTRPLSFSDFNNLNKSGIQVHIVQLREVNEIKAVKLKSLAKLGGGEYLETVSAKDIYRLLKKKD